MLRTTLIAALCCAALLSTRDSGAFGQQGRGTMVVLS
jgi:hypothetical protein